MLTDATTAAVPEADPDATAAPDPQATADAPGRADALGTVIAGKYTLTEPLGEGGMGTVYLARQSEPVRRFVAVKLIKAGLDSKAVLARFEAERQALALMDHPNIAKVLDAGATPDGRPYFAMELVKGVPITAFCDARKLTPRERLELFVPVCRAVQHAHQKGVIHRDIKPSNVMVALYDGKPVPKVIDFGVAKATGQPLTDKTLVTGFGAIVGTPEYMAPEQAELNQLDVDTRADVYALGVLLYELLTGSTPLTRQRLGKAVLLEVLRLVREEEPPLPSTRLSTADALPSIAANRGTEPRRLAALMRGELDWVVMKALDKDRARRYETVNALARDVERYLADEPVEAGRPTAAYRLRKFARKHRSPLALAALAVLGLVAAVGVSTWQAVRATEAEALADKRLAAMTEAEVETAATLRETTAVADFLVDAFRKPDPDADGPSLKVVDLLGPAVVRLDADTAMEPRTRTRLRAALAATYRGLGMADKAVELGRTAKAEAVTSHGPDAAMTFRIINELGLALINASAPENAVPLLQDVFRRQTAQFGAEDPETLTTMNNLALALHMDKKLSAALPLFEECLAIRNRVLPADHRHTLTSLHNLACLYRDMKRVDVAIGLHEDCLRRRRASLGESDPGTLLSMNALAQAYTGAGRAPEAIPILEACVRSNQIKRGADHRITTNTMTNLGSAYRAAGRTRDAIRTLEQSLALQTATLKPDHPLTLTTANNLARAYIDAARPAEAIPILEDTVRRRTTRRSRDDDDTLYPRVNLGRAYRDVGRTGDAVRELTEALAVVRPRNPDHKVAPSALRELALAYEGEKRWRDADPLWNELLATLRRAVPADAKAIASALEDRGLANLARRNWPGAQALLREALAIREGVEPDGWATANARSLLGGALLSDGNTAAAEQLLRAGYEGLVRAGLLPEPYSVCLPNTVDRLVQLYEATGDLAAVTRWRAVRKGYPPEQAPAPRPVK